MRVTKYRVEMAQRLNGEGSLWYLIIDEMEPISCYGMDSVPFTIKEVRVDTKVSSSSCSTTLLGLQYSNDLSQVKSNSRLHDDGPWGRKRDLDELTPSSSPSKPKVRRIARSIELEGKLLPLTRPKTASGTATLEISGYHLHPRPKTPPSPHSKHTEPDTTSTRSTERRPISRPMSLVPLSKSLAHHKLC